MKVTDEQVKRAHERWQESRAEQHALEKILDAAANRARQSGGPLPTELMIQLQGLRGKTDALLSESLRLIRARAEQGLNRGTDDSRF